MDHDDAMRSLRLMGKEGIPSVYEITKEMELIRFFEVDTATGKPIDQDPFATAGAAGDD